MRAIVAALLVVAGAGCALEPTDPCAEAAAHIASCTDEAPAASAETTCDAERAESLLAMDCDQLAAAGKSDGLWEAFLCGLGFSSYCPARPDAPSTPATLTGVIYRVGTTDRIDGALIQLRDLETGGTRTVTSGWGGVFSAPGLADHEYEVRAVAPAGPPKTVDMSRANYVTLYAY